VVNLLKVIDEFGRPRSEIYDENIADSWSAVSVWPAKTKSLPKTFVADQRVCITLVYFKFSFRINATGTVQQCP